MNTDQMLYKIVFCVTAFHCSTVKRVKVMFSQASVCSTREEVTPDAWWDRLHGHRGGGAHHLPPDRTTTPPPPGQGLHSPPVRVKGHNTSPPGQVYHLPPLDRVKVHNTSPPTSGHYSQAGGTHPTGMHSCYKLSLNWKVIWVYHDCWFEYCFRCRFSVVHETTQEIIWHISVSFLYLTDTTLEITYICAVSRNGTKNGICIDFIFVDDIQNDSQVTFLSHIIRIGGNYTSR